jgi:3-deoxy-D-manno-octulosonic acid kinase
MNDPSAYITLRQDDWECRVLESAAKTVVPALLTQKDCTPLDVVGGRGGVWVFPLDQGEGVLRKYRRGGMIRHFVADRYLLDNRPLKEFTLLCDLHQAGLPVPRPLGACWHHRFGWYMGRIATCRVAGRDLAQCIARPNETIGEILLLTGKSIRRLHEAGVWHADLNPHNIIISDNRVVFLDFDRAKRFAKLPQSMRAQNLLRLRRSLRKMDAEAVYAQIVSGYGPLHIPGWVRARHQIQCLVSTPMQKHAPEDTE